MALSKDLESVMDFDYMTFMEDRGLVGVPETCFSHVEASHDTGIKENMVVELQLPGEAQKFWLATIVNTHCALLSLTLVGDKEGSKPLWHDLSKKPLYPLGWCQRNKIDLEPPDEIKARVGNWQDLALQYLEDISIDTLDLHHVDAANGGGLTPAERLKVGMALEIQDLSNPDGFWPARITDNRGGLLTLEYLETEAKPLHIYFTSERLFPYKYGSKDGKQYVCPVSREIKMPPDHDLSTTPADIIKPFQPEKHLFKVGDFVEYIPALATKVELAKILQVFDSGYFTLGLVRDENQKLLCHAGTSSILPLGWSKNNLSENLRASSPPTTSKASRKKTLKKSKQPFEKGQKLEVFIENHCQYATVTTYADPILVLELDRDPGSETVQILAPVSSLDLFPFGWATNNFVPLQLPKSFIPEVIKDEPNEVTTEILEEDNSNSTSSDPKKELEESVESSGSVVFFNYQCYSANFLSKTKLAGLPRKVGPGNVKLVIKNVLELLIAASYKSSFVMRRIEVKEGDKPRKGYTVETIKAKSKVGNKEGRVEIPTISSEISSFCREVCRKLGACPYLISPTLYEGECPAACQSKPRSEFHAEEQSGIAFRNKNRRNQAGRKRKHLEPQHGETKESTSSDEYDDTDETMTECGTSAVNSRSASPETLAGNDNGSSSGSKKKNSRKEWEHILPKSAIRTRGRQLPDFSKHLKLRPSKKEQREIARQNSWRNNDLARPTRANGQRFKDDASSRLASNMPPPIRPLNLKSNPEFWTPRETATFLAQTTDCSHLAHFMIEDDIDGLSFMLLTFPTVQDFWALTLSSAVRLCQHVESVKLAYVKQYRV